jgi:hypothetical protein
VRLARCALHPRLRRKIYERSATMSPQFGYFDPGSGSLLLQLILGGSAGVFVLAKYLWEQRPFLLRWRKTDGTSSVS